MARSRSHPELAAYLRQINEIPLLTADEEKELGWRIINDHDPEARHRMIVSNLRLVVAIAKQFASRRVPLVDLIEEGNVGLIRAVEGFDPAQGTRFSTYAAWWIKQSIRRILSTSTQPIHVPAYMLDFVQRFRQATRTLTDTLGRQPSSAELAAHMGVSQRKLGAIRSAASALACPSNAPVGDDGESLDVGALLADTRHEAPDTAVSRREEFERVLRMLDSLSERDARILRLRYGLEGMNPRTLNEVGSEIGLTRERVRQIEVATLQRLHRQLSADSARASLGRKAG